MQPAFVLFHPAKPPKFRSSVSTDYRAELQCAYTSRWGFNLLVINQEMLARLKVEYALPESLPKRLGNRTPIRRSLPIRPYRIPPPNRPGTAG